VLCCSGVAAGPAWRRGGGLVLAGLCQHWGVAWLVWSCDMFAKGGGKEGEREKKGEGKEGEREKRNTVLIEK